MAPDTHAVADENLILRDVEDGICNLILNRPEKRNPLSTQMLRALQDALDNISEEKSTKVVVLAAKGPVFSAGHDLKDRGGDIAREA